MIERCKNWIPSVYQKYITDIRDVYSDGNCGFRSVAVALGWEEDQWLLVRTLLLEEMEVNKEHWENILNCHDYTWYQGLYNTINWREVGPAPLRCWMDMPSTGLIIAQKFGVVLQHFCPGRSYTFFPMFDGPNIFPEHRIISICWVNRNHFIMLKLAENSPMPTPDTTWSHWRFEAAEEWERLYKDRLEMGEAFMPRKNSTQTDYVNIPDDDSCL